MSSCNIDLKDKENENSIKIQELFWQYIKQPKLRWKIIHQQHTIRRLICFSNCSMQAHYYETIFQPYGLKLTMKKLMMKSQIC